MKKKKILLWKKKKCLTVSYRKHILKLSAWLESLGGDDKRVTKEKNHKAHKILG